MKFVKPEVFHLATTKTIPSGLSGFLARMGAEGFEAKGVSEAEKLIEVAGRSCYRSFKVGGEEANKNLTRVREDSMAYLGNILKSKHGSVLEHASDTFAIVGLSRIATHEIVRHRAGCAYSQESLRFVRASELSMYAPTFLLTDINAAFGNTPGLDIQQMISDEFKEVSEVAEKAFTRLTSALDRISDFNIKKRLTSAFRRLLPAGQATVLIMTANQRSWRHMIEMRTSRHAEEEMRYIFCHIFQKLAEIHPYVYQDAVARHEGGTYEIVFENGKI